MGRSNAKQTLTPLELEIMQVLWASGPSPVAGVQERLGGDLKPHLTAVAAARSLSHISP